MLWCDNDAVVMHYVHTNIIMCNHNQVNTSCVKVIKVTLEGCLYSSGAEGWRHVGITLHGDFCYLLIVSICQGYLTLYQPAASKLYSVDLSITRKYGNSMLIFFAGNAKDAAI